MPRAWINGDNTLYAIRDNQPECWLFVAVWRVMWQGPKQRVILNGYLPYAKELIDFPEHITLEVLRYESGPPDIYRTGDVEMRFIDCRVRNKWINRLVINRPDDKEAISIFIELDCNIEVITK